MGFAARPHLVVRRLEPPPQRFALGARHVGRLAPLLLQIADLPRNLLGVGERAEPFHLRAELFLHAQVGELLPPFGLAHLLHFRR